MKIRLLAMIALTVGVVAITFVACNKNDDAIQVTGVTISSADTVSVETGKTVILTSTVSPENATNKKVVWTTSNPSVATVSNGTVTAVDIGTATITVTTEDGGKKDTCIVTVTSAVVALSFTYNATFDIPVSTVGIAIADINLISGVSGGKAPYTFSATGLPSGITVSTAGVISGTPITATAADTATITVEDSSTPTAQSKNITINYGKIEAVSTFVAVTDITGIATGTVVGTPLILSGIVTPSNATNKTIVWSVKSAGTTGATVSDNTLNTTAAGTTVVTATIVNGKTTTTAYTKDFTINVSEAFVAVKDITGVTTSTTAGTPLTLSGTVTPSNATNKTITWSVKSAGTTGAIISGNTLNTTSAGTAIVTATVVNGKTTTTAYTKDFTITVSTATTYKISTSPATLAFGSLTTGYMQPETQTVTITNTGTGSVMLTQPTAPAGYTVGTLSSTTIDAGAKATFSVHPNVGLAAGTYNSTIIINGSNSTSASVAANFTVTDPALTYKITASPVTLTFGSLEIGYTQPAAQTVTITNTGTGNVTLLQPTAPANFAVSNLSATNLAAGAIATFAVQPNAGLTPATYNEHIDINGSNGVNINIPTNFTVMATTPKITITSHPKTLYVLNAGSIAGSISVTASVTPAGTPLNYKWWYSNNSGAGIAAPGPTANTANFNIPTDLPIGYQHYYYCVVSAPGAVDVKSRLAQVIVTDPNIVISINTEPGDVTVTAGSITGSLSVTASVTPAGTPLNYQWWYSDNGGAGFGAAPGPTATTANFTIPTNLTAGKHVYYCTVNATNATPAESRFVTVTVN